MKSLTRWNTLLGIMGAILVTSGIGQNLKLLALTAEEVKAKLQGIPVFAISNAQGGVWTIQGKNNAALPVLFVSLKDAQNSIAQIETKQPELKSKLQVIILPLGDAYQNAKKNNAQIDIPVAFWPVQQQVELATQILKQENQKNGEFKGVPLFFATIKEKDKEGYLVITKKTDKGEQTQIPFFFDKEQIQQIVDKFKKDKPDQAADVNIRVIPLEQIIVLLEKENDETFKNLILFPSKESEELIQKIREQQQQGQPQPQKSPQPTNSPSK